MPKDLMVITFAGAVAASQMALSQVQAQPRPLMPPAGSTVTSNQPTLECHERWSTVSVELCADHACTRPLDEWTVHDGVARVRSALAPGMYFWRVANGPNVLGNGRIVGRARWSSSRSFRVPPRPREVATDTAWGGFLDVNCDGFGDAAVSTQDPQSGLALVEVFHGSTAGLSASAAWSLHTSTLIDDLSAVGDLNNDGCGELGIVAGGMLAIHPGSPAGLGAPPWAIERPSTASPGARLMLDGGASVDRNGSELVLHGDGKVWLYPGIESGITAEPGRTYGGPSEPALETSYGGMADFNGDRYGDLVLVRSQQSQLRDIKIVPGWEFGPSLSTEATIPTSSGPSSCIGDIDADGVPELLLAGRASAADGKQSGVSIYPGGRTFLSSVPRQQIEIPATDLRIYCADINGDGRDDLLVRRRDPSATDLGRVRLSVYVGGSNGLLTLAQTLNEEDYVGDLKTDFAAEVSAADLNGDGRLELVLTAPAAPDVRGQSGLLLIFAAARGDDLGTPTVRTGAAGFAQRMALGFR